MADPNLRIRQMSLDLSSPNHIPLNARIAEFRQDPQNMDQMTVFVDDVINTAQKEANKRLDEKKKVRINLGSRYSNHKIRVDIHWEICQQFSRHPAKPMHKGHNLMPLCIAFGSS